MNEASSGSTIAGPRNAATAPAPSGPIATPNGRPEPTRASARSAAAARGARVLMLLENAPYPLDARVRQQSRALVEAGYRVAVICPADPGQPWHETLHGVHIYRFPAPRGGDGLAGYLYEYGYSMLASLGLALLVLARHGIDVIHAANPPDTFALIAAPFKLGGKRFIYDHHDLSPEMYYARFGGRGNRLVHALLLRLERFSCRLADHVIATNGSYRALEIERDGVRSDRVTIVRNGPDLSRLRSSGPDPELRAKAGTIIAFAGVMGYQDGVDYLVRALHHLVFELGRKDVCCVFIGGKGDAQADLKALVARLGLEPYTWFTGWVSDEEYVRYLSTADICVAPDPANPFTDRSTMIKVMEYMALAKPLVAFDLTEHRASAGEAAVYVRPNGEAAMAHAIAALIDDPERRRRMGQLGRRRVEEQLAWPHSIPNLLAAYAAALGRR